MYIEKINGPEDVKKLSNDELTSLAAEMRQALLKRASIHGGHIGPNFGMVEATIALHYVFESPKDKFVFDVSHQTYPHKMLTGRKDAYLYEEHYDDVSGYSNPEESDHDHFVIGHTSTSISLACGLAKGRDVRGESGNVIAIILYMLLGLIPAGIWGFLHWRKKSEPLDFMLLVISALLFVTLYYMINPGLLSTGVPGTGKWSLGSTFYSVLLGYLLIRILLHYKNAGTEKLQKGLWFLLGTVSVVLVYGIFGQELGGLLQNLETVQKGNTGIELSDGFITFSNLTPTYVFLFLNFAVRILPYVLNIIVVFLARRLLAAMKEDLYQEESVKLAEKLSHFCVWTLVSTIGLGAVFNLLQLFFQSSLYQIEYVVAVPVFSLAFVLAVLLFAKYIREMQRLKEDNDLFI